jgi:branched-chain amino acid transport system substrate-binding protein
MRSATFALLFSLVLSDVACKSGEAPASSTQAVEIGVLVALSGALAGTGKDNSDAANLAVEQIKAAGGVLGRPLKLIVEDERTTPEAARVGYSNLVARKVPVIIGPSSSSQVVAVADLIAASQTLTIGRTCTSTVITSLADNDYFFRLAPSDVYQGKVIARTLADAGVDRVCLVHRDDTYGTRLADNIASNLSSAITVVRSAYNPNDKDLSGVMPKCEALTCKSAGGGSDAGADGGAPCTLDDAKLGVVFITFRDDGESILRDAQRSGLWSAKKQKMFVSDGFRDTEIVRLGLPSDFVDGMHGTTPWGPDPATPEGERFRAYQNAFAARYGVDAPPFTQGAYDAVFLAAAAIELSKSTSPGPAVRDALRKLNDPAGVPVSSGNWKEIRQAIAENKPINYRGVTGNVDFDENGDVLPPHYYRYWRIEAGSSVTERIIKVSE